MSERNHMPKPEAYWIALGITIAATAVALGARRRALFFDAIRTLSTQHDTRERVVSFKPPINGRLLSLAVRGAVTWLSRLVEELDDGDGR